MASLIPTHYVTQPEDDLRQTIQSTHTEQLDVLTTGHNSPRAPYEAPFSPQQIQSREEYSLELSPSEVADRSGTANFLGNEMSYQLASADAVENAKVLQSQRRNAPAAEDTYIPNDSDSAN